MPTKQSPVLVTSPNPIPLNIMGEPVNSKEAQLGLASHLRLGETAHYIPEGLQVRFKEVVSDSRCPIPTDCVQPGIAEISVEIKTQSGLHALLRLSLDESTNLLSTKILWDYLFTLVALESSQNPTDATLKYEATIAVGSRSKE
jgi:hypothetical protein